MIDAETQEIFRQEAEALVESLQAGLLSLNDTPEDMEIVSGVFRDLHTLKGTGAMFGFTRLAGFVHNFEAAYEHIRSGDATVTPDLIAVSLKAYDLIVALLEGEDPDASLDAELTAALEAVTSGGTVATSDASGDTGKTEDKGTPVHWELVFRLPFDFMEIGGNPVAMIDELVELGGEGTVVEALTDKLPPLNDYVVSELYTGWKITLPGSVKESDIRDVFMFHEDQMELALDPVYGAGPTPSAEPEAKAQSTGTTESAVTAEADKKAATKPQAPAQGPQMRVSATRLDDIMDRVGELVIAEARLAELAGQLNIPDLSGVVEDIQRLALGLRDSTMAIRMTPLSSITGRFKRLAHDLEGKTGKKFDFIIEGEETELDKTVIEKLTDPLVHIIRNAADHGLEPAEIRKGTDKPEKGTIRLVARYAGAEVLISVVDDGKGLDPAFIRKRAIERGMIAEDTELSRKEVFALLLEPGFSTAEQVTDLSGRGVGTDVVRKTVEELRGTIEIESELGKGSTFTLRLPLTLAIIDGMLIQVGDERYTIPLAAVERIMEVPTELARAKDRTTVREFDEQLVSVLRLRRILGCEGPDDPHPKIIFARVADSVVGLVVDRIIGSYQTVIKQLSPLHTRMRIFSGATILGDGEVALILDVGQLVNHAGVNPDVPETEQAA